MRLNVRAAENYLVYLLDLTYVLRDAAATRPVAPLPDERCLVCHRKGLAGVTGDGQVRVSHVEPLTAGMSCRDCHSEQLHWSASKPPSSGLASARAAGDAPVEAWTDPHAVCRSCHDGLTAASECRTCHPGGGSDLVTMESHPPGWTEAHGLGDLNSCGACHEPSYCAECHDVPLPHADGFLYSHGEVARGSDQACLECHRQATCDSCHVVEMPHPVDYLQRHGDEALDLGGPACGTCHLRSGCDRCHEAHIHPGLPDDLLNSLTDPPRSN